MWYKAGSSLAVEVDLWLDGEIREAIVWAGDELRFVLLTSYASCGDFSAAPATAEKIQLDDGRLALEVTPSEHEKCVRCWHYRADVGFHRDHPELCSRCVDNVYGKGETRRIA